MTDISYGEGTDLAGAEAISTTEIDATKGMILAPETGALQTAEQQMISSIMQIASDPSTDVEKVERLLDVQIKLMDRQAKMDYDNALARVQADMPRIKGRGEIKNKSGITTATFLRYEDIDREIRPRLQNEGFSLLHDRKDVNNKMIVITTLKHRNGHQESVEIPLPYDAPNAMKNAVQAAVSTYTYGKRTNVCSMLNIVQEGVDDDGQNADANPITDEQAQFIKDKLRTLYDAGKNIDTKRFLNYIGASSVETIPMKRHEEALELLSRKEKEVTE